jgi:hypothetical protein
MRFLKFTAGELLVPFCRSTLKGINGLQPRFAPARRSYSKDFCNDRICCRQFDQPHNPLKQPVSRPVSSHPFPAGMCFTRWGKPVMNSVSHSKTRHT